MIALGLVVLVGGTGDFQFYPRLASITDPASLAVALGVVLAGGSAATAASRR